MNMFDTVFHHDVHDLAFSTKKWWYEHLEPHLTKKQKQHAQNVLARARLLGEE